MKRWGWVHRWSSVVSTAFLLLLCLTGLPMIFTHEIAALDGTAVRAPELSAADAGVSDATRAPLDAVLAAARRTHPDRIVQFASQDDDGAPLWYVTLTPTPAPTQDFRSVAVDARTARVVAERRFDQGVMSIIRRLHIDLFAGLPGKLFLGSMGLLLLVAMVSGVVLYAPFMRRLAFGTVRVGRATPVRWLDRHNLIGIATALWFTVVGATGVINTVDELLYGAWKATDLQRVLGTDATQPPIADAQRAPVQRQLESALARAPGMTVDFIAFPGTSFSGARQTTFYLRGSSELTARLLQPVVVDAADARVVAVPQLPLYLKALQLSRPLHFGDTGGLPMKLLWALLDVASIIVLGSGLYLFIRRMRPRQGRRPAQGSAPQTVRAASAAARSHVPAAARPQPPR